ncbi:MAG: hypothetical protein WA210_07400 [Burkholderiaceae bacterium]
MKFETLLCAAALAFAAPVFAADEHSHAPKARHGGIVTEASDIEFELVAKADSITIYVRDHGAALATQGASGKLFILSGADKTDAALTPAGDNKLQSQGSFKVGPGTKLVATVNLQGRKPINMRFALK